VDVRQFACGALPILQQSLALSEHVAENGSIRHFFGQRRGGIGDGDDGHSCV
jgi:hypothetical protein